MDIAIEIRIAMAAGEVPAPRALETAIDIDVIAGVVPERASDIASEPAMDIDIDPSAADTRHALAPIPMPRPRPMLRPLAPVRSPTERLGLDAEARVQAEDCLARAIYFEARGESVRGQIGIAQVIMNRVFSRYYPDEICGVVYQDAHRRNACQFSFACDGKPEAIADRSAWSLARHIARLALGGRVWDAEIGRATHYHAVWVQPWWVDTMRKLAAHGVHIFYRPIRWGDGSDEPYWSRVAARAVIAALN